MDNSGGLQRELIADLIGRNRMQAVGIRKRLERLHSLMRGPSPAPERKDPPRDTSIVGQSRATSTELGECSVILDRMLEDFELRENQSAGDISIQGGQTRDREY